MKVAGSSIEAYLLNFCGEDDILTGSDIEGERESFGYVDRNNTDTRGSPIFHMHTPPCMLYALTDIDKESFFKFSVVRNPWDTVVSYFWWCFYSPTSSVMSSCDDPSSESAQQFAEISPRADDDTDVLREKFTLFVDAVGHFNAGPRGDEGFQRKSSAIPTADRPSWHIRSYRENSDAPADNSSCIPYGSYWLS